MYVGYLLFWWISIRSISSYCYVCRKGLTPTSCPLCSKDKVKQECVCPSSLNCADCKMDSSQHLHRSHPGVIDYKCSVHGNYRQYEAHLLRYKSWCMLWVIILVVPYGLVITESGINLLWCVLAGTTLGSPFLLPIILTLGWSKTTGKGAIAGKYLQLELYVHITIKRVLFTSLKSLWWAASSEKCLRTCIECSDRPTQAQSIIRVFALPSYIL